MVTMGECRRFALAPLTLALGFTWLNHAHAGEWVIKPRVTAEETLTDNLFLTNSDKESDFVTEITPGVKITGRSRHFQVDLDYQIQNLIYASNGEFNETNQQFNASGRLEMLEDYLFLDAGADVGQRQASINGQRSIDTLNVIGNRVNYENYRASPFFRHEFGGIVNTEIRYSDYRYSDDYQDTGLDPASTDTGSNNAKSWQGNFVSGRKFTRLQWGLFYSQYEQDNARGLDENGNPTSGKDKRESTSGQLSYFLFDDWSFVAQGGEETNQIAGLDRANNGSYWSAGVSWQPSRHLNVRVLDGANDREVGIKFTPTVRTNVDLSWRDRDVGSVVGPSWNLSARHKTRHTTWSALYQDSLTSEQQLVLTGYQPVVIPDPNTGRPVVIPVPFYGLNDENFRREYGDIGMSYALGRNDIYSRIYQEKRSYELTKVNDETVYGFNTGINFGLAAHSTINVGLQWDHSDFDSIDRTEEFYTISSAWRRALSPDTDFEVALSHTKRDTSGDDQALQDGEPLAYDENRVMARLTKAF